MCGILGVIQKKEPIDRNIFQTALDTIKHRGPESEGQWFGVGDNVALGHRRLAIIDLSPGGYQPMQSADGRFFVTFNGEIYNYKDLKKELSDLGNVFKSESDTEVLLYAYIQWGEKCLEKLNGMFAFAIWDQQKQELFAARDRLGEKPFKYYLDGDRFIFASEIKAILKFPYIKREIDWQAIDLSLSLRYVPAPKTGFKGISKLPAGHYLIFKDGNLEIKQYWSVDRIRVDNSKNINDWQTGLWDLFKDSIQKRMISDVPVGAFLSGGVDSSSVVAAVSEIYNKPLDTFVISTDSLNEDRKYARIVADYFHTNHHEIQINDVDYVGAVLEISKLYDEPFFDQSALPSVLISRIMKKHATVVLSGDGSDELFGGYKSFQYVSFLKRYKKIPLLNFFIKKVLGNFSNKILYKTEVLSKDFFASYSEYYSVWKRSLPYSKMYVTKEDLYLNKIKVELDGVEKQFRDWFGADKDVIRGAMLADVKGVLADGYLAKMDFATMGSAVEVRPPFLDYRLVELSRKIPTKFKIKNSTGKYIWKELMKTKLPPAVLSRPKMGFVIPLDNIIVNQLRPLVESLLLDKDSNIYGYFQFSAVQKLWSDHLNKKADYSNHLWSLLMLELWIREHIIR